MFSHSVLKRFVKDYSLPIQIVREPYFEYYIDIYDKTHNTKQKLNLLKETIKKFKCEDDFLSEYHKIKDNILDTIKGTEPFKEFNNSKLDEFNIPQNSFSKHDIFNLGNVNKYFISIDLKKANFQSMKYYNKDLVLGFNTYDELMSNFTDLDYMKDSKYIRQVIFGNMNPKKQIKIEQYLTWTLLQELLSYGIFKQESVRMFSPDEIVVEISEDFINHNTYADIDIEDIARKLNLNIDIEVFKLNNIGNKKFFAKEFINKSGVELMCVPIVYYAQAYKKYYNLDLTENDLCFFYENQVCKFIQPLDFESEVIEDECESDERQD